MEDTRGLSIALLGRIKENAEKSMPVNSSDIVRENGEVVCGVCGELKKSIIEGVEHMGALPYMCRCEREKDAAEKAERERRELEFRAERLRSDCFPVREMREDTFENDDGGNSWLTGAMRQYVEKFPELRRSGIGFVFYGPRGRGKSFMAHCVANALIDKGFRVKVTSFPRLHSELNGYDKQERIDALTDYDLVIVDDLGAERGTEYARELDFNIIDTLYSAKLPLAFTTNLTREALEAPADFETARIFDRIRERCKLIEVSGEDRRAGKLLKTC